MFTENTPKSTAAMRKKESSSKNRSSKKKHRQQKGYDASEVCHERIKTNKPVAVAFRIICLRKSFNRLADARTKKMAIQRKKCEKPNYRSKLQI